MSFPEVLLSTIPCVCVFLVTFSRYEVTPLDIISSLLFHIGAKDLWCRGTLTHLSGHTASLRGRQQWWQMANSRGKVLSIKIWIIIYIQKNEINKIMTEQSETISPKIQNAYLSMEADVKSLLRNGLRCVSEFLRRLGSPDLKKSFHSRMCLLNWK